MITIGAKSKKDFRSAMEKKNSSEICKFKVSSYQLLPIIAVVVDSVVWSYTRVSRGEAGSSVTVGVLTPLRLHLLTALMLKSYAASQLYTVYTTETNPLFWWSISYMGGSPSKCTI